MIQFLNVAGDCMIEDGTQCQYAYPGMTVMLKSETVVIATGIGSHAVVDVNGNRVTVAPSCYMKVSPAPLIPRRLLQKPNDLKNAILKAYMTLHNDRSWNGEINATVGVRG